MRDYFDRLEDHLLAAVERHGGSAEPRRRVPVLAFPRQLRPSTMLAAVVLLSAIAVAGVFLGSVRTAAGPSAPSGASTAGGGGLCGVAGANRIYREGGPRALLSILGVLRRPQTPRDLPPARWLRGSLRTDGLNGDAIGVLFQNHLQPTARIRVTGSVVDVYRKYIRLARAFDGRRYYVIPQVAGADVTGTRRCIHPVVSIDVWSIDRWDDGGGGGGGTATDILAGAGASTGSWGNSRTTISFLVPDDVATVTMRFPITTNNPAAPRVMKSVTIKPVGNVVAFQFPADQTGRWRRAIWRSAAGKIIPQGP